MTRFRWTLFLTATLAVPVAAGPAAAQAPVAGASIDAFGPVIQRNLSLEGAALVPKACELMTLECGQTVSVNLTSDDCSLEDGTFFDLWSFSGQSGQTVTIDLVSNTFDAYLFLFDPTLSLVATDDDSGDGTNARIVFTLDQTSSDWTIAPSSFFPGDTGSYTLTLQCPEGSPPSCDVTSVQEMIIGGAETHGACRRLEAGPSLTVTGTGSLTLQAGATVALFDGFVVESGGALTIQTCGHSLCTSGAALSAGCHDCASAICAVDDSCCSVSWDGTCVDEVASVCGLVCP